MDQHARVVVTMLSTLVSSLMRAAQAGRPLEITDEMWALIIACLEITADDGFIAGHPPDDSQACDGAVH